MMIVDAIRSASSPQAVYFLVTAYIESLRHFEGACGVAAEVLELPLGGDDDLHRRLCVLRGTEPVDSVVPVTELAAVLSNAIERLAAVFETASGVMPHARTDSPRSALSV